MRCEICKQNEATVSINHVAEDQVAKVNICESCAAQKGLNLQMAVPLLTDLILGLSGKKESIKSGGGKQCPVCHMKRIDFRKTSLLGCAACYDAFADEVSSFLESMQKGVTHTGKVPVGQRVNLELDELQKSLQQAVRDQDFERAAQLRDEMRDAKSRRKKLSVVER